MNYIENYLSIKKIRVLVVHNCHVIPEFENKFEVCHRFHVFVIYKFWCRTYKFWCQTYTYEISQVFLIELNTYSYLLTYNLTLCHMLLSMFIDIENNNKNPYEISDMYVRH